MANEALVGRVKVIVGLLKGGDLNGAYAAYANLFGDPAFLSFKPEEQRQALKLMILSKGVPQIPTPAMVEAHRRALAPLVELVRSQKEPGDYELLGVCQAVLGDEKAAARTFQAGLDLERSRNPQSDLCGALMKRVASV